MSRLLSRYRRAYGDEYLVPALWADLWEAEAEGQPRRSAALRAALDALGEDVAPGTRPNQPR